VRFFIDEDLTPTLVEECHRAGYDATSVRDRNMLQATDREVARLCFVEDRVLVTNNATDFLKLAEEEGMHPGLVFLPLGSRADMRSWMKVAIEAIEKQVAAASVDAASLMINCVLDVDEEGECKFFDYPKRTT
jgi:predicted nuclease of predicted toxin-antitoxin system